MVRKQRVSRV